MLEEYRALIGQVYNMVYWPFILISFVLCKDANVRWTLFILGGFSLLAKFVSLILIPKLGFPGWLHHVAQIFVYLSLIRTLIIFRPLVSLKVGRVLAKIPLVGFWLATVLPSQYPAKIFMAELAIRRLCYAFVVSHSIVLLHYLMYYCGALKAGGLYEKLGVYQLALWDMALAVHTVAMSLELLLLLSLVITGCKYRWTIKA